MTAGSRIRTRPAAPWRYQPRRGAANDVAPLAPAPPPEVLTVDELAALLRFNVTHVYELVARGVVPGVQKVGGAWRAHRPTVVAWLAGQVAAPKARRR